VVLPVTIFSNKVVNCDSAKVGKFIQVSIANTHYRLKLS